VLESAAGPPHWVEASALLPPTSWSRSWPGPSRADAPGLVLAPVLNCRSPRRTPDGRILGRATVGEGRLVAVGVRAAAEHTLLVGPTGSGKNLAGRPVGAPVTSPPVARLVLDPRAAPSVPSWERLPEEAIARTILVDPTDENTSGTPTAVAHEAGASRNWRRQRWWAAAPPLPRPRAAFDRHLVEFPLRVGPGAEATLFDLLRLWSNAAYRATVAARVADDPAWRRSSPGSKAWRRPSATFILAAPMTRSAVAPALGPDGTS